MVLDIVLSKNPLKKLFVMRKLLNRIKRYSLPVRPNRASTPRKVRFACVKFPFNTRRNHWNGFFWNYRFLTLLVKGRCRLSGGGIRFGNQPAPCQYSLSFLWSLCITVPRIRNGSFNEHSAQRRRVCGKRERKRRHSGSMPRLSDKASRKDTPLGVRCE